MTITVEIDGKSAEIKLTDEQIIEIGKKYFELTVVSTAHEELLNPNTIVVKCTKRVHIPQEPDTVLLCTNTSATNTELNVANSAK